MSGISPDRFDSNAHTHSHTTHRFIRFRFRTINFVQNKYAAAYFITAQCTAKQSKAYICVFVSVSLNSCSLEHLSHLIHLLDREVKTNNSTWCVAVIYINNIASCISSFISFSLALSLSLTHAHTLPSIPLFHRTFTMFTENYLFNKQQLFQHMHVRQPRPNQIDSGWAIVFVCMYVYVLPPQAFKFNRLIAITTNLLPIYNSSNWAHWIDTPNAWNG